MPRALVTMLGSDREGLLSYAEFLQVIEFFDDAREITAEEIHPVVHSHVHCGQHQEARYNGNADIDQCHHAPHYWQVFIILDVGTVDQHGADPE